VIAGEAAGLQAGGPATPAVGGTVSGNPVVPSSALTSYSRPASTFASEEPGRPVGRHAGMLSAATTSPGPVSAGGALPVSLAQSLLRPGKSDEKNEETDHARVVLSPSIIR